MEVWDRLQRTRAVLRAELTPGERLFAYSWLILTMVLPFTGAVLIGSGHSTRGIGIVVLIAAAVWVAIPVSRILRARVRRRQQGSGGAG